MTEMNENDSLLTKIQLKQKLKEFLSSRKNANNVVDVLNCLIKGKFSGSISMASLLVLEKMFEHVFKTKGNKKGVEVSEAEQQYEIWIKQQYETLLSQLLKMISSPDTDQPIREQALSTYMKLLTDEARKNTNADNKNKYCCLPPNKFYAVLKSMISIKKFRDARALLSRFKEYSSLHDIALQIWVASVLLTKFKPQATPQEHKMKNLLTLLQQTPVPSSELRKKEPEERFFKNKGDQWSEKKIDKLLCANIDTIWTNIHHWPHIEVTLHLTLLLVLEKFLTHLSQPILLTDFFMNTLDQGGVLSVLALQGIFKLIQEHNIEYPNIYGKLYSLLKPEIFDTPYKARLLFLTDIFLTSTHIPEALVAAFAKKLARLALLAPAPDILILLPFIGNLILRHKGLQVLINHPKGELVCEDPYLEFETDPMQSQAMQSSLWEIKSLQNHALPAVSTAARFIDEKLPAAEWDLADVLEGTYDEMFKKELKKRPKGEIALTYIQPNSEKILAEQVDLISKLFQADKSKTSKIKRKSIKSSKSMV